MPFEVGTKDCTSLSDAELAEMADLCVEREPGFDIGFLSKQCEEWVLITLVREGNKLRGYSFSTLERIGGTPSLLIGVATVDRTVKAEQALRLLLGDQYRRALLAFPDEDVLVGTRLASCPRRTRPSSAWPTSCPGRTTRPRARSGPGAGVWPSASVPRAASTTGPSSWLATAGRPAPSTSGGPKVKVPGARRGRCCSRA